MYKTKSFWAILILSVALAGSIALNVVGYQFMKVSDYFCHTASFQNAYFNANQYNKILNDLRVGDIEHAKLLATRLIEANKETLKRAIESDMQQEEGKILARNLLRKLEADLQGAEIN